VRALRAAFGQDITVPEHPDTIGALGAALIAREKGLQVS
jgi:activator of 2-hydroxyglutaryl-CoA dehydratase